MDFSSLLNPAQLEAVEYCDGPSLVIAGAGSGKTRVLTYKIAYLLQNGMQAWQILALTFTNKAAREMNLRIADIVGQEYLQGLWSGTFHSIFARLLRREAEHIGFQPNFTIYDTADSKSLIKLIIKEMGLDDKKYKPSIIQGRISEAKNRLVFPDAYCNMANVAKRDQADDIPETGNIYKQYFLRCKQSNAMDFDDLLLYTYVLFRDHDDIRKRYQERFQYILVDEYQDTNFAQHTIVGQLTTPDSRICVVGDDAQSIYAFRGANIDNILEFTKRYPTAKTIKLERNYRSTQNIVNAANSIIAHNQRQIPKKVYSENHVGEPLHLMTAISDREEAAKVVGEIMRLHRREGVPYNDIAILYRVNALSRSFEEEFNRQGVPYRIYGGQSFYQRKEIKDVIAYFRLILNPQDEEAFRRVVNYPARGIGNTSMEKLIVCARSNGASLWDVASQPSMFGFAAGKVVSKLQGFCDLVNSWREGHDETKAYDLAARVIRESGIMAEFLGSKDPEIISKRENIDELLGAIRSFEKETLEESGNDKPLLGEFLQQVSLISDTENDDEGNVPKVTLMTIHAAKGLEYRSVFIVGMEDEIFPGQQALYPRQFEEERRLFYVAVTRAKEHCFMSYANSRFRYGKFEQGMPSRFLNDVDAQFVDGRTNRFGGGVFSKPKPVVRAPQPMWQQPIRTTVSKPSTPSKAIASTLSPGVAVIHERFGKGIVLSLEGAGDSACAMVKFEAVGVKKLLLKFAKLEVAK